LLLHINLPPIAVFLSEKSLMPALLRKMFLNNIAISNCTAQREVVIDRIIIIN